MKFYTVAELKTNASRILEQTHKNHTDALITRHGKPLALIVPISEDELQWSASPAVKGRLRQALAEKKAGRTVSLRKISASH